MQLCLEDSLETLHQTEACSLLDQQCRASEEQALACGDLHKRYRDAWNSVTGREIHWAHRQGRRDCVSLLKRLAVL